MLVCFFISILGVIEYFSPSTVEPLSGYFSAADAGVTVEGFTRASFSFWGAPVVVLILILFLPSLFTQWQWLKTMKQRLFLLVVLAATILAGFISGYRSAWLLIIFMTLLYFSLRRSLPWVSLTLIVLFCVRGAVPETARNRAESLMLLGSQSDSSATDRLDRIENAWQLFLNKPLLGQGLGGSGWVHCDLLQIAANLGAIALIVFLFWYGITAFKLWRVY